MDFWIVHYVILFTIGDNFIYIDFLEILFLSTKIRPPNLRKYVTFYKITNNKGNIFWTRAWLNPKWLFLKGLYSSYSLFYTTTKKPQCLTSWTVQTILLWITNYQYYHVFSTCVSRDLQTLFCDFSTKKRKKKRKVFDILLSRQLSVQY